MPKAIPKPNAKRGRPTKYTKAIASRILLRLSMGESLRSVCRDKDMPDESTVRDWAICDRDGFSPQYAKARDCGLDAMADELLEIADDASNDWMENHNPDNPGWVANQEHIARSRLRLDTRKWLMSKMAPKRYGDRIEQHLTGDFNVTQITETFISPGDKK